MLDSGPTIPANSVRGGYGAARSGRAAAGLERRGALDALAQRLRERETLDEEEIPEVTGLARAPKAEGEKVSV
ncbi:MAG TPA: hypothetical protein VF192_07675 [Longimicrobiales bacterium]